MSYNLGVINDHRRTKGLSVLTDPEAQVIVEGIDPKDYEAVLLAYEPEFAFSPPSWTPTAEDGSSAIASAVVSGTMDVTSWKKPADIGCTDLTKPAPRKKKPKAAE